MLATDGFGASRQFSCSVARFSLAFSFSLVSCHLCVFPSLPIFLFRSFCLSPLFSPFAPFLSVVIFFLSSLSIYLAWDIFKWILAMLQLISLGFMVFLHFHPYSHSSRCHCGCGCLLYLIDYNAFLAKFMSRTWILWSKWVLNKNQLRFAYLRVFSCAHVDCRQVQTSYYTNRKNVVYRLLV